MYECAGVVGRRIARKGQRARLVAIVHTQQQILVLAAGADLRLAAIGVDCGDDVGGIMRFDNTLEVVDRVNPVVEAGEIEAGEIEALEIEAVETEAVETEAVETEAVEIGAGEIGAGLGHGEFFFDR